MNVRIETSNEIDYGDVWTRTSIIVAQWDPSVAEFTGYHSMDFATPPL